MGITNPVTGPLLFATSIGTVVITNADHAIDTDSFGASITSPDYVSGTALGIPDSNSSLPNFTIIFATPVAQVGFGLFDPNFEGPGQHDSGNRQRLQRTRNDLPGRPLPDWRLWG